MVEEKDFDLFDKIQTEVVKKIYDVSITLPIFFLHLKIIIMQIITQMIKSSSWNGGVNYRLD